MMNHLSLVRHNYQQTDQNEKDGLDVSSDELHLNTIEAQSSNPTAASATSCHPVIST